MNSTDSLLSIAAAAGTATYTHDGSMSPWITQVIIPIIAGVVAPVLKELGTLAIATLKARIAERKKQRRNDD